MIPASDRQLDVIPCEEPERSLATSILTLKNAGWGISPNPRPKLKKRIDMLRELVKPRITKQMAASSWLLQIKWERAMRRLPVFL